MLIQDFELIDTELGLAPGELPSADWLPALVPGGVHESLLALGRIDDPYADRHEKDVRWVEERAWWFRSSFTVPEVLGEGERALLVFHGLDTVVDIWLNDQPLGHHENMFRPAKFDVTDRLLPKNDLLLCFSPPLAGLAVAPSVAEFRRRLTTLFGHVLSDSEMLSETVDSFFTSERGLAPLRRKAPCSWGWDFGPRLPSIGIWRPVELRVERRAVIGGHHVHTLHIEADQSATIDVVVEVDGFASADELSAQVELVGPSGRRSSVTLPVASDRAHGTLTVEEAELWWTHDLGDPALYDVTITLLAGESVLDRVTDRVGMRTIVLDRSADPEGGNVFRFILNGVPIFARGANWLPADMLVGSVDADRVEQLVGLARDGGMNMLRVWGGGIYEQDAFYVACDETGVLVWQDFMFACSDYPESNTDLAGEVAREAEYQVRRLRNHPSLALWCGNNEVQAIHGALYQGYEPGDWGYDFFYRVLPEAVASFDGVTPYWPGSPWGEDPTEGWMAAGGALDGDRHAWEVWHGSVDSNDQKYKSPGEARHYHRYADDKGKFISEFGIHASPELLTLSGCLPKDQFYVHSESFDHHNKDHPKNKHDALLEIVTGLPETIEQYVDFTMISQAEGLKFGVEHFRRRAPHCNGTLVWQFNDVWPGFSWSVVDHNLVPKAGYHYLTRAYAPLLASFQQEGDALELWLSNSGRSEVTTVATVTIGGFDGSEHLREEVAATIAPGDSRAVWADSSVELTKDRFAWVATTENAFPANRFFFAQIKDIPFGEPKLSVTATSTGPGSAVLHVDSAGFAHFVHARTPAVSTRFDKNYFDLRHGESARIEVTGLPDGYDPTSIAVHAWQPRVR